jgi:hypothetical protein
MLNHMKSIIEYSHDEITTLTRCCCFSLFYFNHSLLIGVDFLGNSSIYQHMMNIEHDLVSLVWFAILYWISKIVTSSKHLVELICSRNVIHRLLLLLLFAMVLLWSVNYSLEWNWERWGSVWGKYLCFSSITSRLKTSFKY